MLIVAPDFDRRIDLPGAGPCPRPVDIDRAKTGFARLVSLRVYSFASGMVIDGEAEEDEVFITLMRGAADIGVDQAGARVDDYALRETAGPRAVYLPPHAAYQLTAVSDCDIAYARVRPDETLTTAPRAFAPDETELAVPDHAAGMELLFTSVPAGERLVLADSAGGAPERFVHVRTEVDGAAEIAGERCGDWTSAILAEGETATLATDKGRVDVLTISASPR